MPLPDPDFAPAPPRLSRQRDSARTSLLRANTAVAVVIVTVLFLALGALWQSVRATRLQGAAGEQRVRAETAEENARTELWHALQSEAKATRLGQTIDRRAATLESLRRAAEVRPTPELRNEAVAALALPDRALESSLPLDGSIRAHELDPTLTHGALGLTNGDVVIRRLADGAEIRRFRQSADSVHPEQGRPVSLGFSPDGSLLGVRYLRGALAVWEAISGRLRFVHDGDVPRRQASLGSFSHDGRHLIAPVFDPDGFAVLETATGRTVAHFPELGSFNHAAARPGTTQFAGYDGRTVLVIDWETRRRQFELPLDFGVYHLAWSPDGRWLGIFGNSLEIQLWDVAAGRMRSLHGHQDTVYHACFDTTGELLAGMSADGVSRIWNLQDGRLLDLSENRRLLRWGTEGRVAWLVPRERLEVWRERPAAGYARAGRPKAAANPEQLDISPDGRWAVGVTAAEDGLIVWPLRPPGPPEILPLENVRSACFEPGSDRLLIVRDQALETFTWSATADGTAAGFRLNGSEPTAPTPPGPLDRVTCSADGQTRAFVHVRGGAVWVQRRPAPADIVIPRGLQHYGTAFNGSSPLGAGTVALSPDGRWLACGADGLGVRAFDTATGLPVATVHAEAGGVQFSADGRWLVVNGWPECALIRTADWTVAWRSPLDAFIYQPFGSAAVSPDGTRMAHVRSPTRVTLVETEGGRELAVLEAPSGSPITALRWAPDGRQLVATTREHSLDVWQLDALGQDLAGLGLDWNAQPALIRPATARPDAGPGPANAVALTILLTAGAVAAVALLSLRRHRQLIEDFSRAEALASKQEQELEIEREVGRLKSSFVSMVSHEFRTPLGITMSAVELLQNYFDRLSPAKRTELLADIHSSTRHMSDLMEQVLLLGRVEAGKLGFKPSRLDLGLLLERLADETASATHRRCPVRLRIGEDLDGAEGDESLLRHILGNLISNAVKYSPAGTPVELSVERRDRNAVFRVRDHGIGIPEADVPQLFQAFQRASNVGDIPGSGLGLVIVRRCVDLHGGWVEVTSQPGNGTEFTVGLPVFGAPRSIASAQKPSSSSQA